MRYFVLISMFILYFVKLLIIAMILVYICTLFSLMTGFFLQCTIDGNNTLIFFQDFLNFSRYFFKSLYIIYQSARNFMMISNMYNLMFISSIPWLMTISRLNWAQNWGLGKKGGHFSLEIVISLWLMIVRLSYITDLGLHRKLRSWFLHTRDAN